MRWLDDLGQVEGEPPDAKERLAEVMAEKGYAKAPAPKMTPAKKVPGGPGAPRKECGHSGKRYHFRRQNGKVYSGCADCHMEASRKYREKLRRGRAAV